MRPARDYASGLDRLFHRQPVVLLDDLRRALGTKSRTTIFRILSAAGYLTSFDHAGRYYTLRRIPDFDERGLWFWRDVGGSPLNLQAQASTSQCSVAMLRYSAPSRTRSDQSKR